LINREAAMRNLLTAIFSVLLIALAGTEPAQSGDATFRLTNNARFSVMVKVFSQSRHWEWPATTRHWTLDDSAEHDFRLSCQDGEKMCYGGSFTTDDKTHWGVGYKGDKSCQGCCITCGSNVTHGWSLVDGAARPAAGGAIDPGTNLVPADE
jgi:hypothetical protein